MGWGLEVYDRSKPFKLNSLMHTYFWSEVKYRENFYVWNGTAIIAGSQINSQGSGT